jgi:hypothetical protein
LPEGVSPKKYDETADAAIAISKHGMATPFYRTAGMQEMCGIPLAESVQSERCQEVAEALAPIYQEMKREAAKGKVFYADDTPVKIMELIKENKEKKERKGEGEKPKKDERVGMQTTGMVVELAEGARVVI